MIFIEEIQNADGNVIGVPFNADVNGEGDGGYCFYFDDNQSTELVYQKRLIFLSDKDTVAIEMPENDVFFLFKYLTPETGLLSLEDCKAYSIESKGEALDGKYIHYINIGCCSKATGEYIEDFTVDGTSYEIAADFHSQDESLRILLANQGLTLPTDVQRALYDTNIKEKYPDWIIINRKFKELLINATNILYKKGSYKSLMDSLGWFEWEGVRLNEYWSEDKYNMLHEKEISSMYSNLIDELLGIYRKTTFISLSYNLNKNKETNGVVKYDMDGKDATVPILEDIQNKWGVEDLMLKMTLLGNYFSTYFMPIHLDLLFSSVVKYVYATPLKAKSIVSNIRIESTCLDTTYTIWLKNHIKQSYRIQDINSTTICMPEGHNVGYESEKGDIFRTMCAVVPLRFGCSEETYKANIIVCNSKGDKERIEIPVKTAKYFDLKLYLKKADTYTLTVISNSLNEKTAILNNIIINVSPIIDNHINVYRMERVDDISYIKEHVFDSCLTLPYQENNMIEYYWPNYMICDKDDHIHASKENRVRMYFPDSVRNYISCCMIDGNEVKIGKFVDGELEKDFYTVDVTAFADKYDKEYKKGVDEDKDEKLRYLISHKWYLVYKEVGNKKLVVLFCMGVTDEQLIVRQEFNDDRYVYVKHNEDRFVEWYDAKRFLPMFWRPTMLPLISSEEDAVYIAVPNNRNLMYTDPLWEIENISTGVVGVIKGLVTPIFWGPNKKTNNPKGIYSITLHSKYDKDSPEIVTTEDHIFQIK